MRRLLTTLAILCFTALAHGQGIPFIHNFTANDYHANNTNFDIETDKMGNVFVANFEGLLYYDQARWRIIRAPGITRITVVYRAADNTIWVGGYNYFGKVVWKANGDIGLRRIGSSDLFRGEVSEIYEKDGILHFINSNGTIYQVKDDKVSIKKKVGEESLKMGMLDVVNVDALEKGEADLVKNDTVQVIPLGSGMKAFLMKNEGLLITDDNNHKLYTITDANGLCTNNVSYAAYDGRGHLWGATGKGIFVIQIPAVISRFTPHEGLMGTVLSIESINGKIFAGTDDGLFRQDGYRFVKVSEVAHACWELKKSGNGLLAATADGVFRIYPDGKAHRLTNINALALLEDNTQIYSGETNGIYLMQANGQNRKKVCNMDNVKKIVKDKDGTIWAQNLYGTVWYRKADSNTFLRYKKNAETMQTIVMTDGRATIVSAESTEPFPYPLVSYLDDNGVTWLTDNEGKKIYRWKGGKKLNDMDRLLFPLHGISINTIYTRKDEIWLGNDNGLIIINSQVEDPTLNTPPKLYIRSVTLSNDSVLWGGFGNMPQTLPALNHDENNLSFTFSLDCPSVDGEAMYRYRLNNDNWSSWSPNTTATFGNLSSGKYTFSVQARDLLNRISNVASIEFQIKTPFYYRWYMNLLYLMIVGALVYVLSQLRLRRLQREKDKLEKIVQERTAEVVRLEKMATAGKLTQGLIDRILNPLNYIINFSKLSEGLVKDARANVEDEKENMEEENYEDTMDVLDMLSGNLQKVGEHGQNTTRTLKAMEEMLKDRSGGMTTMDLMAVVRQDKMILQEYFKHEIEQYGIQTIFDNTDGEIQINGNADQLSQTIMSLLGNAVYAVVKKAQKQQASGSLFTPEINLHVSRKGHTVYISIRDNGIGIEDTILEKIFDPFFTTKTTSEAAGVGLYLSREIVQNHGGDIQVKSVKDEYSEFIITLPVLKA